MKKESKLELKKMKIQEKNKKKLQKIAERVQKKKQSAKQRQSKKKWKIMKKEYKASKKNYEKGETKSSIKKLNNLKTKIYKQKLDAKTEYDRTRTNVTGIVKKYKTLIHSLEIQTQKMKKVKSSLIRMQNLDEKLGTEKLKYKKVIKSYLENSHKNLVPEIYSKEIRYIDTLQKTIGRRVKRVQKRISNLEGASLAALTVGMGSTKDFVGGSKVKLGKIGLKGKSDVALPKNKNLPTKSNKPVEKKANSIVKPVVKSVVKTAVN